MRNKAFRTHGRRGIVRSCQFGNGPLPNWILNTHLARKSFRTEGMSRIRVLV
jgi:ribosomal protein L35AE/L33A